jgi:hypothetical protein
MYEIVDNVARVTFLVNTSDRSRLSVFICCAVAVFAVVIALTPSCLTPFEEKTTRKSNFEMLNKEKKKKTNKPSSDHLDSQITRPNATRQILPQKRRVQRFSSNLMLR